MNKILVIDDDNAVRLLTSKALQKNGYAVLEAATGQSGLELARHQLPNLVLCDLAMPGLDGFDVLQNLRSQPATAAMPFILMTGVMDDAKMRAGMELGADDYLPKPFTTKALCDAVQARLSRQHNIQEQAKEQEALLLEILSAAQDLVAVTDAETHRLIYLNRSGRQLLGIRPEEDVHGLRLEDFQVEAKTNGVGNGHLTEGKTQIIWNGDGTLWAGQAHDPPVNCGERHHRTKTDGRGVARE